MAVMNVHIPDMTGEMKRDLTTLYDAFLLLRKELEFVLANLDEDNVVRASAVDAGGILSQITSEQIESLAAGKITAGTLPEGVRYTGSISANQITNPQALFSPFSLQSGEGTATITCFGLPFLTVELQNGALAVTLHWEGEENGDTVL